MVLMEVMAAQTGAELAIIGKKLFQKRIIILIKGVILLFDNKNLFYHVGFK